jgi:hypothetical protein
MKKAAERSDAEKEIRNVIRQSAHCSFIPGIVQSISGSTSAISLDSVGKQSINRQGSDYHDDISRQTLVESDRVHDVHHSSASSESSSIYDAAKG